MLGQKLTQVSLFCHLFTLGLLFVAPVYAVAPGTDVASTATVRFVIDGNANVIESSPLGNSTVGVGNGRATRFIVDQVVNLTVTSDDTAGTVGPGNAILVLAGENDNLASFTVTNQGNGVQDILLTAVNSDVAGANNVDLPATALNVFVESGATVGYQVAEDTAVFIDNIGASESRVVYVLADAEPLAAANDLYVISLVGQVASANYSDNLSDLTGVLLIDDDGQQSTPGAYTTVTVQASDIPAAVTELDFPCNAANDFSLPCEIQVAFGDPAGNSVEDLNAEGLKTVTDTAGNGQASDSVAFLVTPSPVSVRKFQEVLSANGPHRGAIIRYRLEVSVLCRTDDITNVVITDPIPNFTAFNAASPILLNGAVPASGDFNVPGGAGFDTANNRVVVNMGTIAGRTSCPAGTPPAVSQITFEVTIN